MSRQVIESYLDEIAPGVRRTECVAICATKIKRDGKPVCEQTIWKWLASGRVRDGLAVLGICRAVNDAREGRYGKRKKLMLDCDFADVVRLVEGEGEGDAETAESAGATA